jgi:hypothetical protein
MLSRGRAYSDFCGRETLPWWARVHSFGCLVLGFSPDLLPPDSALRALATLGALATLLALLPAMGDSCPDPGACCGIDDSVGGSPTPVLKLSQRDPRLSIGEIRKWFFVGPQDCQPQ